MNPHRPPTDVVILCVCPACFSYLRAALGMAGRRTLCPFCDDPMTVPRVPDLAPSGTDTWTDLPVADGG